MPLTLVKEDGTGRSDANAYASQLDGEPYHEGHLYATAWSAATSATKDQALVMATRLIDALFQFNGTRSVSTQALQWPREDCRDPDADGWNGGTVASNYVPRAVVDATCELARELIVTDRTEAPLGEGIYFERAADGSQTIYSKSDRRPILPAVVQALLLKYGTPVRARSGTMRLVRA
jgi:hypothetical protein